MSTLEEAAGAKSQLGAALASGTDAISQFQEVTFVKYRRVVLPADGFVFWVKNSILNSSALLNTTPFSQFAFNWRQVPPSAAEASAQAQAALSDQTTVSGSLHYATTLDQTEEETFSTNRVIFTAEAEVNELNQRDPNILYLATVGGVRFAFSSRDNFYFQAGLWHYTGNAVYADMASQVIDDKRMLNSRALIVSNSLPIWLAMNACTAKPWDDVARPAVSLYPSFLVKMNLPPPFVAVHISPESTKPIAAAATFDPRASQVQLVRETVKLTLFGFSNDMAQDFVSWVVQYSSANPGLLGISNSPVPRDEKRAQVELQALAQKKTVEVEVNYYQSRVRAISRQLLLEAQATLFVEAEAAVAA